MRLLLASLLGQVGCEITHEDQRSGGLTLPGLDGENGSAFWGVSA